MPRLQDLWCATFPRWGNKPLPPRQLVLRELARRAQSKSERGTVSRDVLGGADAHTRRLLNAAVREAMKSARASGGITEHGTASHAAGPSGTVRPRRASPRVAMPPLPAAAKLIRHWRGRAHEVTVVEGGKGFVYRDRTYRSLSAIALAITGSACSGPKFFGLTAPPKRRPPGASP